MLRSRYTCLPRHIYSLVRSKYWSAVDGYRWEFHPSEISETPSEMSEKLKKKKSGLEMLGFCKLCYCWDVITDQRGGISASSERKKVEQHPSLLFSQHGVGKIS